MTVGGGGDLRLQSLSEGLVGGRVSLVHVWCWHLAQVSLSPKQGVSGLGEMGKAASQVKEAGK